MLFKSITAAAIVASSVAAQRPSNMSICDYYTTALLKNNTAANQATLLTLVVNTAVIGNYTMPNVGIKVTGILAPGTYNGTAVNLLPYFNGGLASTNTGGSVGRAVNFLDDGGAAPLMKNMPANSKNSAQYTLLTHLYEYFGVLLGCTMQGNDAFPAYAGSGSMYSVHKFMDLSPYEVGYFIQQVGMSAASFGVAAADVTAVGMALGGLFDYKCAAPTVVVPAQGAQLQSICIQDSCPLAPNNTCSAYNATMMPAVANATLVGNSSSTMGGSSKTSSMPSSTGSNPATISKASAATIGMSFAAAAGGLAAIFL